MAGQGCASGEITEVFACGTAAVITPVGEVKGSDGGWTVGDGPPGPVTMRLREELLGVQFGHRPTRTAGFTRSSRFWGRPDRQDQRQGVGFGPAWSQVLSRVGLPLTSRVLGPAR